MQDAVNHTATPIEPVLTPDRLAALRAADPSLRILDVRTPGEHSSVHIPGSYNVPVDELAEHAAEVRRVTGPIVLVCQSGTRARRAEALLARTGLTALHVLEGGMQGWMAAGLPVVRGPKRLSLERQVRIAAGSLAAAGALLALTITPLFALVPLFVGGGLVFAGVTDRCGMALLLGRLPYNRGGRCDVPGMVATLAAGQGPRPAAE
jgi:rhodanese-related sulfurtransferase